MFKMFKYFLDIIPFLVIINFISAEKSLISNNSERIQKVLLSLSSDQIPDVFKNNNKNEK